MPQAQGGRAPTGVAVVAFGPNQRSKVVEMTHTYHQRWPPVHLGAILAENTEEGAAVLEGEGEGTIPVLKTENTPEHAIFV